MEAFGIILVVVVVAILFRLVAGSFDGERVESYVKEQGWELVDRSWDPFGPGWFGDRDTRIYAIVYRDQKGNLHKAHVKTSMFSGVYLTKDEIVEHAQPKMEDHDDALKEENERLKERIKELEGGGV